MTAQHMETVDVARTRAVRVNDLRIGFPQDKGYRDIVRGVSLSVEKGRVLGIVGESGSGKTMLGLSMLGLLPAHGKVTGGEIELAGMSTSGYSDSDWRKLRGTVVGMVFQDAMTALNPVRTVGSLMEETVRRLRPGLSKKERREVVVDVLERVGIPEPVERLKFYPHELSGGLRQRVLIGTVLLGEPDLIIADEPTTALDSTIQAQILDLLVERAKDAGLILITHDLGVAAQVCDDIAVLYAGKIMEYGSAAEVLSNPVHPYTYGLVGAIPTFGAGAEELRTIPGVPPSPRDFDEGCPFRSRCPRRTEACDVMPNLDHVRGRVAACWNPH